MNDRFPPDWFLQPQPWPPGTPNAPLPPTSAPPAPPDSNSGPDDPFVSTPASFNWVQNPNGGLVGLHPNGIGIKWMQGPNGGMVASRDQEMLPSWLLSAIARLRVSAKYRGATPRLPDAEPTWPEPAEPPIGPGNLPASVGLPRDNPWLGRAQQPVGDPFTPVPQRGPPSSGAPSWLPTAEWRPPEPSSRLSHAPDGSPRLEPSWEHLWPTETPAPKTWQQQARDALNGLDQALWHRIPPELRPKVAALAELLSSVLPGSGTADSMEAGAAAEQARREGNYGAYVANLGSGMVSAASDWIPMLKGAAKALLVGGIAVAPAKRLEAEAMERAGKSIEEIWHKTRLERGPDGQWFTELSDAGYQVVPVGRVKPLYQHHVHPAAMEVFPDLAHIESRLRIRPRKAPSGSLTPDYIEVQAPNLETAKLIGLHELTHLYDRHTGHPIGGRRTDPDYPLLASEVRANNSMERYPMSEEERAAKPPSRTQVIPNQ